MSLLWLCVLAGAAGAAGFEVIRSMLDRRLRSDRPKDPMQLLPPAQIDATRDPPAVTVPPVQLGSASDGSAFCDRRKGLSAEAEPLPAPPETMFRGAPPPTSILQTAPVGSSQAFTGGRTRRPPKVVEVSPRAVGRMHIDADVTVLCHQSQDGVWLVTRSAGSTACWLGDVPLEAASLPVTARARLLRAGSASVDLGEFAASGPERSVLLVGGARAEQYGGRLFRATVSGGVVVAALALCDKPPGADATRRFAELVDSAGTLFVPGASAHYATEAIEWQCRSILRAATGVAVALVGAGHGGGAIECVSIGPVSMYRQSLEAPQHRVEVHPRGAVSAARTMLVAGVTLVIRLGTGETWAAATVALPSQHGRAVASTLNGDSPSPPPVG